MLAWRGATEHSTEFGQATEGGALSGYRVAMDIGGTFTDLVVVDEGSAETVSGKVLTTPADPAHGVLEGLRQFVPEPGAVDFLVHGTTVGLNAFLERKGTRLLLIMTEGLRDAYSIARHDRKELYALRYHKPERLRATAGRRSRSRNGCAGTGAVETPLVPESLEPVFARIRRRRRGGSCGLPCSIPTSIRSTSSGCVTCCAPSSPSCRSPSRTRSPGEWREYERASSAVLNAYIAPRVEGYLGTLERELGERDVPSPLYVMQSNGGITSARSARREPIQTLLSGPVGGTIGGAALPARPAAQPALHRHGRDVVRPQPRRRRQPDSLDRDRARGPARPDAARRHPHDRRRGRLAGVARGGRPTRRAAERGRGPRPGLLRAWRNAADGHGRQPLPGSARSGLFPRRRGCRSTRGGPARTALDLGAGRARRHELAEGCSRSSTRRWRTRCGRSPSSRASTRASMPSSRSAGPARCTPSGWRRSSRSVR